MNTESTKGTAIAYCIDSDVDPGSEMNFNYETHISQIYHYDSIICTKFVLTHMQL